MQQSLLAQAVRVNSATAKSRRMFMDRSPSIGPYYTQTPPAALEFGAVQGTLPGSKIPRPDHIFIFDTI
jgi:hypothetical protein